uniref:Uncharacterized protein n=1 Tax=Anguilla anguilla TaxID=7936 RepID=A0A0E9VLP9_ANGAN
MTPFQCLMFLQSHGFCDIISVFFVHFQ